MRLAPLTWPRLRVTLATLAVALVVAAPAVAQTLRHRILVVLAILTA